MIKKITQLLQKIADNEYEGKPKEVFMAINEDKLTIGVASSEITGGLTIEPVKKTDVPAAQQAPATNPNKSSYIIGVVPKERDSWKIMPSSYHPIYTSPKHVEPKSCTKINTEAGPFEACIIFSLGDDGNYDPTMLILKHIFGSE